MPYPLLPPDPSRVIRTACAAALLRLDAVAAHAVERGFAGEGGFPTAAPEKREKLERDSAMGGLTAALQSASQSLAEGLRAPCDFDRTTAARLALELFAADVAGSLELLGSKATGLRDGFQPWSADQWKVAAERELARLLEAAR